MRTIYVILAEKQYTSSKVLAAFDTQEGADKLKELIDAVDPKWLLSVQPVELQVAPSKPVTIRFEKAPDVYWNANQASIRQEGEDFVATIGGEDPPSSFIPENPDGPGAAS